MSSSGLALAQEKFPALAATLPIAALFKPSPVVSHIPREIPTLTALLIALVFHFMSYLVLLQVLCVVLKSP